MLNPRHRSEQGSGRCASLEEDCTLCVFFGVFLAFGAAGSSASSSPSSSSPPPPACSFGSMAFLFAAESCAFLNFVASQGTITEFADLNYSIRTQAQPLKQHTISINLICKYQLHACIHVSITLLGGRGARARSQAETPSLRKIQSSASVHQPSKPAPASQPVCHTYHVLRRYVNPSDSFHSQHPAIKQHSIKLSSHAFVQFIPAQFPFHGLGHCHLYHNRQSLDRGDFHSCALATRELGI